MTATIPSHQARLLFTHDDSDPYFSHFVLPHITTYSIALITKTTKYVRIHELDADNIKNDNHTWTINTITHKEQARSAIHNIIHKHNITEILLNYSTMGDSAIDIIGHGTYLDIQQQLQHINPSLTISSAERLIYAAIDTKTPEQIEKMTIAAERAHHIIIQTLSNIAIGMSEQDIYNHCHQIMIESQEAFFAQHPTITHETYARGTEHCPIVLSGENFTKGGHAIPSDRTIQPGDTVYIDFGVTLTFDNGENRSSDLQRMAYILEDSKITPPTEIQKRFDTIVESINSGIHELHPKNTGHHVDEAVRNHITSAGYPNYNHSTGHPIGETAHNPGTAISSSSNPRSHLYIQNHGVYTIEPRIALPNGVSVEEMVVVDTKKGNYTLCPRQTELILIRPIHD